MICLQDGIVKLMFESWHAEAATVGIPCLMFKRINLPGVVLPGCAEKEQLILELCWRDGVACAGGGEKPHSGEAGAASVPSTPRPSPPAPGICITKIGRVFLT